METNTIRQLSASDAVSRELWYVRDRRIRTRSAAQRAIELVEQIRSGQALDQDLDDTTLFAAMHTCAYRATRNSQIEPATGDDRRAWVERWRDLREYIVNKHVGLAYMGLSRFDSGDWDEDDRASEAMYALGRAVRRFNPWKGFRFSTYACNAIVRALMRRMRREHRYRRMFPVQFDVSCEQPVRDRHFDDELYAEKLQRVFAGNLAGLTDLEAGIISRRFLVESPHGMTLQRIGHEMGLCKERIRQLQNTALRKLRAALDADPVLR
jgi:RNA polymerase primary sigma factor